MAFAYENCLIYDGYAGVSSRMLSFAMNLNMVRSRCLQ